ncbi:hypothetical protein PR048_014822 [Dryococelus australis]|uniref:PiggyBac transposable element-derived protein domain-containing protein n=1 Tax=Dryococelus australis TaxID=614101 RepID=A0ABQ9HG17_9NEOP|nr:hypothetical protein PR048_014822 [Dryococelus australis]
MYVRSGVSGIVYDLILYAGEDTFRGYQFSNEEKALGHEGKLVRQILQFTTVIHLLRSECGIFGVGILQSNRLRGCDLKSNGTMKKEEVRGSCDQLADNEKCVAVVKWYDNKSEGGFGGGEDLSDMFVALYRTAFKTHRWYLGIFSQLLDICINNTWLYYRRQQHLCRSQDKADSPKEYRRKIAGNIMLCKRSKRGRPPVNTAPTAKKFKEPAPAIPKPDPDVQFDDFDQLPVHTSRGRCRYRQKGNGCGPQFKHSRRTASDARRELLSTRRVFPESQRHFREDGRGRTPLRRARLAQAHSSRPKTLSECAQWTETR